MERIQNMSNAIFKERIRFPISDAELKRRYDAVSKVMHEQDVDLIVMSNDNQFLGGYVRYFLDIPTEQAYPVSAIYAADGDLFSVTSGNPANPLPPEWAGRFIKERLAAPYFRSLDYTGTYDAKIMVKIAKDKNAKRIGLVGADELNCVMVDYIRENSSAEVINFTKPIDKIRSIKSQEEIEKVFLSAKMHDKGIEFARSILKPGIYEYEIRAEVKSFLVKLGSEEQLIMMGSAAGGAWTPFLHSFYQNRQLQAGDDLLFMIEANGPGGYYTEIGRTFSLGEPSEKLLETFAASREIQHTLAKRALPGAKIQDLHRAYQDLLAERGYPEEHKLLMHGQGYDLVEWPGLQSDDAGVIEENMILAIHPHLNNEYASGYCCDDYLITKDGAKRMHKTPQEILKI
ncbi:MAG: M24 family metallopeptidase [Clostridiales Family XIII bacterium]|nr:M24 family metallopeptidase [Clostridiales Family XIII bacterium]